MVVLVLLVVVDVLDVEVLVAVLVIEAGVFVSAAAVVVSVSRASSVGVIVDLRSETVIVGSLQCARERGVAVTVRSDGHDDGLSSLRVSTLSLQARNSRPIQQTVHKWESMRGGKLRQHAVN